MSEEVEALKLWIQRLTNKVNKVTCAHRHGAKPSKRDLDELSNRQIEFEMFMAGYDFTPQLQWRKPEEELPESNGNNSVMFKIKTKEYIFSGSFHLGKYWNSDKGDTYTTEEIECWLPESDLLATIKP